MSDLIAFTYSSFNASHRFNSLSFGAYYPGAARSALDGRAVNIPAGSAMHQYFVKLVPLVYTPISGPTVTSYQFSVTEHSRNLNPAQAELEQA